MSKCLLYTRHQCEHVCAEVLQRNSRVTQKTMMDGEVQKRARHGGFGLGFTKQISEENLEEGEEFRYMDIGEKRCSKLQAGILEKGNYLLKILFQK